MSRSSKKGQPINQKLVDFLGPEWGDGGEAKDEARGGAAKVTPEEMQMYTIAEDMDDLQRVELFLNSTLSIQQICGLSQLPTVAQEQGASATSKLISKALGLCTKSEDPDVHLQLVDTLCLMFDNDTLGQADIKMIIAPAFKKLQSTDEDVRNGFLDVILMAIDKTPPGILVDLVLSPALATGEVHCTVASRANCCRLLGKLATKLSSRLIADKFFFKAMSLCQDTSHEVRATMCEQLDAIARGVGPDLTYSSLLEELHELLRDEEPLVRSCALDALIQLLDFFDEDTKKSRVLPQLRSLCKDTPDAVVYALADKIGVLLTKLQSSLGDDKDSEIFYTFFKKIATNPDVELRRRCVFNMPAIVSAFGAKRFAIHVEPVIKKLSEDSDVAVRLSLVKGIHEITGILVGDKSLRLCKGPIVALLRDSAMEVKEVMVSKLALVMKHFDSVTPAEEKSMLFRDIVYCIADIEISLRGNWRRELCLVQQLNDATALFTEQQIYEVVMPIMMKYLTDSVLPVREAVIPMICRMIKSSRNMQHRFELTQRLVREFGRARSYHHRMIYADICISVIQEFSRMYFRQYFFEIAFDLLNDPVPNVRSRMCKALPSLKSVLRLPDDQPQLDRLTASMNKLLKDTDNVVVEAAKKVSQEVLGPFVVTNDQETQERNKRQDEDYVQRLEAEATKKRLVDEATERAKMIGAGNSAATTARKPLPSSTLAIRRLETSLSSGDLKKPTGTKTSAATSSLSTISSKSPLVSTAAATKSLGASASSTSSSAASSSSLTAAKSGSSASLLSSASASTTKSPISSKTKSALDPSSSSSSSSSSSAASSSKTKDSAAASSSKTSSSSLSKVPVSPKLSTSASSSTAASSSASAAASKSSTSTSGVTSRLSTMSISKGKASPRS